jgi:hypothetical protein
MKLLLIVGFLILNSVVSATEYYVKNGGNNSADGKSDATAWATVSKVNSATFNSGDVIHFKCGDTWRELLTVSSEGSAGAYLKFTKYGTGENPRILGSITTTWRNNGSNVWVSESSFANPYSIGMFGAEIFFENSDGTVSWGVHKTGIANLAAEYDWTWISNYIYVYSATDPDARFTSVEIPQRAHVINLNAKDYLNIDGIDVFYCGESGIAYNLTDFPMTPQIGLIIENLEIGYISTKNSEAGYGTEAIYSDMIVRHCEVHDCGRRGVSFHLYAPHNVLNILIEDNYFYNGYHTTGPDFSVGSSVNAYYGSIDGAIIRRNLFYDPPTHTINSEQLFLQNYLYSSLKSKLTNIYIYSNVFISPVGTAINMEGTQSVYVYNNTFYNHNNNGSFHIWIDNNNASVKVKNNIFYTTLNSDRNGIGSGLFVRSGQNYKNVDADYNLYYRINNYLRILEKESTGMFRMNDIALIRLKLGWETNSPVPADPLFKDPAKRDFSLAPNSPAIGKGINLDLPVDFYGKPFNSRSPSIGAVEYSEINTTVKSEKETVLFPNPSRRSMIIIRAGFSLEPKSFRINNKLDEIVYED